MGFLVFQWLTAMASLVGVVLNIRRRRACFFVWAVTNASWAIVDTWYGIWAQAVLQAVYCGLALWGILAWKEK